MKYFIAITLIVAVASAAAVRPLRSEIAEIQEIIAAIQSPSTHPATAAALEQMLLDILGAEPIAVGPAIIGGAEGIAVGPAIINPVEGISVGPAIIPFPLPEGALAEEPAIVPSPVAVAEGPAPVAAASSPLVQIIVNVNQAESSPVVVAPVDIAAPEIQPEPVHVVEVAPEPVQVVEVAPVLPVHPIGIVAPEPSPISPPIAVNPIGVAEPQPAEPIQIGVPVIPEAAVVLPEELN